MTHLSAKSKGGVCLYFPARPAMSSIALATEEVFLLCKKVSKGAF